MTKICFAPGPTGQDAVDALRALSSRLAADTPILALGGRHAADAGQAVFASAVIMRLFGARTLASLSEAIAGSRSSRAPSAAAGNGLCAERLAELASSLPLDGPAQLERLPFGAAGASRTITFLCRRLAVSDAPPLFLAAALDLPCDGSEAPAQGACDATPASPRRPGADRFLWRSGADDRLIEIGPRLTEAVGEARSDLLGRGLARVVAGFDPDQGMRLALLFERRESFSGAEILWPIAGSSAFAHITFAGSPSFDDQRRFLGFRGFGLIREAPPLDALNVIPLHPAADKPAERERTGAAAGLSTPGEQNASASIGGRAGLADLARRLEAEWPGERESAGATAAQPRKISLSAEAAFDALPIGVLVCRDGAPSFANRFLLDLLGCADLGGAEAMAAIAPIIERSPAQGDIVLLRDGAGKDLAMRMRKETLGEGAQSFELISLQTRHESRPGADAELRRYQREARELNAILDTAMDGVAVLDAQGRIKALNRSGEALFCYDRAEVEGEPFTTLIAPESRARAEAYFDGLKSNGVASLLNDGREILGLTRQGGPIPIFMTLGKTGPGAATGQDQRYCALLRDMTHWKKVERELDEARREAERASALKSDFLAKVSHEIRTPLNAVLGFAEVIMEERFGPIGSERYKDYLKDIHSSGALVMSLVNDLLDLSKIEAGKMDLSFESVDANRVVTECVSIMQPEASRARVITRLSLAPQLPHIFADERSLRQIVLNLLSNAIKFTQPGGQVIVSTALTDANYAAVRIRDTGVGMSDDDLAVALEPFRQLSTSRLKGGTGLGLPLTKALAEANRASFLIKSKRHEGTLVEVAFPPARVVANRT